MTQHEQRKDQNREQHCQTTCVDGQVIFRVDSYVYLGHAVKLGKENQEVEIDSRRSLAWAAFGRLSFVLKSPNYPNYLKKRLFDACVDSPSTDLWLRNVCIYKKNSTQTRSDAESHGKENAWHLSER
jgi:hypothetical protein